jgi:hypothetical protein
MSDFEVIQRTLERTARRMRWQRGWRGLWEGLFAGALLWHFSLAVYKLFPVPFTVVQGGAIAALLLVPGGFLRRWLAKPSLIEAARWVDAKQHLQERLSTAWEASTRSMEEHWRALLLTDAARVAREVDPPRLLPLGIPSVSRWALIALLAGAGLGFVPEYRTKAFREKEWQEEVIRDAGRNLAELTRRTIQARPPAMEPTRQTLESVAELGETLAKTPVARNEALRDLASATQQLEKRLKEMDSALKAVDRAARAANRAGEARPGELQKQIDALQKALGEKHTSPRELEKMKQELAAAKAAAAAMQNKDGAEATEARQALAEMLSNLSQRAAELGYNLPALEQAIAALQANQTDHLLRDLDFALDDLEKLNEMAQALAQLQQKAARLGKDLAEQLQNAQIEAAQASLRKMINELRSSDLTPEQREQILSQISKAVNPGKMYGRAGDLLDQAAQALKQKNDPEAAAKLAEAAEELQRIFNQMCDAESLLAALEALKRAGMCIGTGQAWAQCNSPGFSPGGKPGSGVGTWTEETGWLEYPQMTELWDNTGIHRPDMDPRGQTDRGDGQLADTVSPTKIRGQLTPGAPMPSITLKGLSVKGQSVVDYQEAITAAQSDAQNALNQDKVPRAYQGVVREYFDDLK